MGASDSCHLIAHYHQHILFQTNKEKSSAINTQERTHKIANFNGAFIP